MLELNKNRKLRGFCTAEVICSVCIFSILFFMAVKVYVNTLNLMKKNNDINNSASFLQGVKLNLLNNFSFNEVIELNKNHNENDENNNSKLYICNENIKFDLLKEGNLINIIKRKDKNQEYSYPHIEIDINKLQNDEIVKIKISYYFDENRNIGTEFIKGNYK
ncbi:hypothetical protein ACFIJ5_11170 [Haloimpatiens sp. FM7330]|uniref:hypothetical protein n=1 Tax=Haloimpatiens sp. FM7330 TaxID=3298610 RepID=UPI0036339AE8